MPTAKIKWNQGHPVSLIFNDVYFANDSQAESSYVFLQHNNLSERFATLKTGDTFTIAETGFGSGLNFLITWQLFNQQSPANSILHFYSVERFPLLKTDMQKIHQLWPDLTVQAQELLSFYVDNGQKSIHEINFANRVILTLIVDEVIAGLLTIKQKINAWFLDGFAPSRNPSMWRPEMFNIMAKLANHTTTFATFTAASAVRQGLTNSGFLVYKPKGFGKKRHMLHGIYQQCPKKLP